MGVYNRLCLRALLACNGAARRTAMAGVGCTGAHEYSLVVIRRGKEGGEDSYEDEWEDGSEDELEDGSEDKLEDSSEDNLENRSEDALKDKAEGKSRVSKGIDWMDCTCTRAVRKNVK